MKKRQHHRLLNIVAAALVLSLILVGSPTHPATVASADGTRQTSDTTTSVSVIKVWNDGGIPLETWPESVTVQLYADGEAYGGEIVLNESNAWSYTWDDLPVYSNGEEIEYTVDETDVPDGFTCAIAGDADVGFTVTNTATTAPVEFTVNNVWNDNNDQDGLRPDSVTVQLYADGEASGDPVVLSKTNNWSYTWRDLEKYVDYERVNYTVKETNVPDGYTSSVYGNDITGFTITNTHTPQTTSVSANKVWEDNDNLDGLRPDSVTAQLYADGEASGDAVVLNEDNNWTYTWTDLDVYKNGEKINYTVEETEVPDGYTSAVSGDSESGFTITNTLTSGITVTDPPTLASETPDSSGTTDSAVTTDSSTTVQDSTPITGDYTHDALYALALLVSAAGALYVVHRRRKQIEES
jgi:serine-aspartate repeat-containing protein C/D/E